MNILPSEYISSENDTSPRKSIIIQLIIVATREGMEGVLIKEKTWMASEYQILVTQANLTISGVCYTEHCGRSENELNLRMVELGKLGNNK
jgi:hypothetical protein